MAKELVNVTGEVVLVDQRSGLSKRTGQPYSMTEVTVLVERISAVTVTLPDQLRRPENGEHVNYLVEVTVFGQTVQYRVLRDMLSMPGARSAAPAAAESFA